MGVSSLQTGSAATTAGILRAAEENPGVAVKLLKKAVDADRDLVQTLLPTVPAAGSLDIRA